MKEQIYETYCGQVCEVMKKATKAERRSLTEELTDHMASHVEVLLTEGWAEDDAVRYAVEAMGDPETVGRQYDEKLSSFWRTCGIVLRIILVVLVWHLVTSAFRVTAIQWYENLQARWAPEKKYEGTVAQDGVLDQQPLDIRFALGEQQVHLYRLDLGYDQKSERYFVDLYVVNYADKPWALTSLIDPNLENGYGARWDSGYNSVSYWTMHAWIDERDEDILFTMEVLGEDPQIQVPVNWEDIP